NGSIAFPYDSYEQMLDNVRLIAPGSLAPGANAFKYNDGSAWLNRVVFPVSTEQFCRDVGTLCPELLGNIYQLDPRGVLSINGSEVAVQQGASSFVRKIGGDREALDFSPVTVGSDLIDHGLPDTSPESVREVVREEIETRLLGFILDNSLRFAEHYRWKVI